MKSKVAWAALLGALIFAAVGWTDFDSGFNLDFSILYYVPVALWAWYIGIGPAIGMACVSGLGAVAKDFFQAHAGAFNEYEFLNGSAEFGALLLLAILVHLLHRRLTQESSLRARLALALAEVETAADDIFRLKQHGVMICPVTRRIGINGEWLDLSQFLRTRLHLSVQESVSEDAVNAVVAKMIDYHDSHEARS